MQISKGFRPLCFFACCGFATLGLQHRWLCFGARAGVEFGLQRVCGAAKLSVPCGPGLPDRAGSGAAQFSEDRDVVGRGGDRSWYAGNAREEPSVTQLHLLLLISPFHIPRSFGCCLLFSSPGPSSRLCEHRRRPSLCVWRHFTPSSWERGMPHLLPLWRGTHRSAEAQRFIPSPGGQPALQGVWGGEVAPKPTEHCSLVCCAFCMAPSVTSLHLCFRVFPLLQNPVSHLWKPWAPHVSFPLRCLRFCLGPTETSSLSMAASCADGNRR